MASFLATEKLIESIMKNNMNEKEYYSYILKRILRKEKVPKNESILQFNNYFEAQKYYRNALNNNIKPFKKAQKINLKLKILRNLPYAKRGYIFKSTDLMKFYKSKEWYKENPLCTGKQSDLTNREKEWLNRIKEFKSINNETFLSEVDWYQEIYYHEIEKLPYEKEYAKKIFNYFKSKGVSAQYLENKPKNGTTLTWNNIDEMKDIDNKLKENPKVLKILKTSSKLAIKVTTYSDGNHITLTFL